MNMTSPMSWMALFPSMIIGIIVLLIILFLFTAVTGIILFVVGWAVVIGAVLLLTAIILYFKRKKFTKIMGILALIGIILILAGNAGILDFGQLTFGGW